MSAHATHSDTDPVRVLLAEPQTIARHGLRAELDAQPHITIVGEAVDGREVLALAKRVQPNVLILDFPLACLDGMGVIQALNRVSGATMQPAVLVYTGDDARVRIIGALSAGARGYLLKRDQSLPVANAVVALRRGRTAFSPRVQDVMLEFISHVHGDLTPREAAVLQRLAQGKSDAEIARDLGISQGAVRHHLRSFRRKLPFIRTRAEAVAWAWMNGLVSSAPELGV